MAKYIAILAAFLTVLVGCVAPVDESAWTNQAQEGVKKMALVPVGPAPGGPFATILCPDDGNTATAEDIRRSTSALLANDVYTTDRLPQSIESGAQNGSGGWSISNPNTWNVANAWQTVPAATNNVDVLSKAVAHAENDWFIVTAQFEAFTLGTVGTDDGLARLTEDGAEFGQRVRISTFPLPISITAMVQAAAAGTKTFTIRINADAAVHMTGPARIDVVNIGKMVSTP